MWTDQTAFCTTCALRFSRDYTICPSCGSGAVTDLRDESARRTALALMLDNQRAVALAKVRWKSGIAETAVIMAGVSIGFAFVHPAYLWGIVLAALLYIVAAVRVRGQVTTNANPPLPKLDHPRGIAVRRLLPDPDPRGDTRGRVRVLAPVVSLLDGRRCAAFRLVGHDDRDNTIDDAEVGELELVPAEGAPIRLVAGAPMTVVLERPSTRPISEAAPALAAFLVERGVAPGAALRLGEAVLLDGEEVVVTGDKDHRAVLSGYRDAGWELTLTGTPDRPLVIRRG